MQTVTKIEPVEVLGHMLVTVGYMEDVIGKIMKETQKQIEQVKKEVSKAPSEFISEKQISERYDFSRSKIRNLVETGAIMRYKTGRNTRYSISEIDKHIKENQIT